MNNSSTGADQKTSSNDFWPAFLLALFLGIFGAHRFYLGAPKKFLMFFTLGGLGIWTFIDIITILVGKFKNKSGQPIVNTNPAISWVIFILMGIGGFSRNSNFSEQSLNSADSSSVRHTENVSPVGTYSGVAAMGPSTYYISSDGTYMFTGLNRRTGIGEEIQASGTWRQYGSKIIFNNQGIESSWSLSAGGQRLGPYWTKE
jgi:hypothetical protein